MQIFDVLIADHADLEHLARQLEAAPAEAIVMRRELLDRMLATWVAHARAEEQAFYEALRPAGTFDELILNAYAEHSSIEATIRELAIVNPADSRFGLKASSLRYALHRHFEEEESWIFDAAKKVLSESEATSLSDQYYSVHLSARGFEVSSASSSSAESHKSLSSR